MYLYEDSEDDYIDMEVGTYINFFDQSQCSTPSPREFEFHMSANYLSKDSTTSPADELFYQGKLLPLHLPPRIEMVEKILQSTSVGSYDYGKDASEDFFSTPLVTAINTPTSANTPFESCNISPSESFRKELDQEQFLFDYVNAINAMENAKRSIAKKTKCSLLGLKLKASKAFLKNLFSKSACSHVSSAEAYVNTQDGSVNKAKDTSANAYKKVAKKTTFGQTQKDNRRRKPAEVIGSIGDNDRGYAGRHRRSISGTIKHRLATKSTSSSSTSSASSSSSSSGDCTGFQELPFFNKNNSASLDIEMSIKGAIAHCKLSQQSSLSKTALCEVSCSFSSV